MISLFKKHWLARQARFQAASPTSSDTRGYTLQTVIVSAILLSTAVLASVVLYRAITTNTDVRAFADLTGDNAPTRPHGFSVEHYLEAGVPSARVRWSPPLYTGHPQLAGSPTLLNYEATYNCEDSRGEDDMSDMDDIALEDVTILPDTSPHMTDLTEPEIPLIGNDDNVLEPEFGTESTFLTGHCLISVRAFTCPDASSNTPCMIEGNKTGAEIYGPPAEHRFSISKTPTIPELLEVRLIDPGSRLWVISWNSPEYLGSNNPERLIYQVEQRSRPEVDIPPDPYPYMDPTCTFNNFFLLSTMEDRLYDVRITAQIIAENVDLSPIQNQNTFTCPDVISANENSAIELPEINSEFLTIPDTPTGFSILPALPDSEAAGFNAEPLVRNEQTEELVGFVIDLPSDPSVDSYILQWNRADSIGVVETQELTDTQAEIVLSLNNGVAYKFSLWARNSQGTSDPLEDCTTVATKHRYLTPNLSVIPRGNELKINIAKPNQQRYCQSESFCFDNPTNSCLPPSIGATPPAEYKIRIFKTDTECTDTLVFPNTTCTSDDIVICTDAPGSLELEKEIIVSSLDADQEYTVEVIAGTNCNDVDMEINNNASPFASFPVAANAMTTSAIGSISADIMPGTPMIMYNNTDMDWTVEWDAPTNKDGLELYLATFTLSRDGGAQDTTVTSSLEINQENHSISFDHDNELGTPDRSIACTIDRDDSAVNSANYLSVECTMQDNDDADMQLRVDILAIYTNPDRASEPATMTGMS